VDPSPRPLRALLVELADALVARARAPEALPHLQQALREQPGPPDDGALHERLGAAAAAAGQPAPALRSYLEAMLAAPARAPELFAPAVAVLEATGAQEHERWIRGTWAGALLAPQVAPPTRAAAAVLLARVSLLLRSPAAAVTRLAEAAAEAPEPTRAAAARLLFAAPLPPVVAGRDARACYVRASLHHALGQLVEARDELAACLAGDAGSDRPWALRLQGNVLEALGEHEAAGAALLEAARAVAREGDAAEAARLCSRAAGLRPRHAPTYWDWMEAERMLAAPTFDPGATRAAAEAWRTGLALAPPDEGSAWAYLSRALVAELEARLPEADPLDRYGEAAARVEAALVLQPGDAPSFGYLARALRNLGMNENAVRATDAGLAVDADEPAVLEERAAALANLGRFAEAAAAVKRRLVRDPRPWIESVQAYILLFAGEPGEALAVADRLLRDAGPLDALWYREIRAFALLRVGRAADARAEIGWLWARRDDRVAPPRATLAWAAYRLGEHAAARARFHDLIADLTQTPGRAEQYLGLSLLATLEVEEGERWLSAGIEKLPGAGDLDQLVDWELPDVEALAAAHPTALRPALARIRAAITARRAALAAAPTSAETEIAARAPRLGAEDRWATWEGIAVRAAQARLAAATGAWARAAQHYAALLGERDRFPVAREALLRSLRRLDAEGVARLHVADPRGALASAFAPALALAEPHLGGLELTAELRAHAAYARWAAGDAAGAQAGWAEAARGATPAVLGRALAPLLDGPAEYWALDDALEALASDAGTDAGLRAALPAARDELGRFLDGWMAQPARPGAADEGVLPIVVQIDTAVIAPEAGAGSALFTAYLPELRERLRRDRGLTVPAVRFRGEDRPRRPGAYTILLHDVPVAWGEASAPPGEDPVRGVVEHLEAVLRRSPRSIFGLEEAATRVAEWSRDEQLGPRVRALDEAARARLAQALQALAGQGVPLGDGRAILDAADAVAPGEGDLDAVVSAARLRLRERLRGNEPGTPRRLLPEALEARIAAGLVRAAGRAALVLAPEEMGAILAALREAPAAAARVVRADELRGPAERLLRLAHPEATVLSRREALDPVEP
jgi:hypothetical protein